MKWGASCFAGGCLWGFDTRSICYLVRSQAQEGVCTLEQATSKHPLGRLQATVCRQNSATNTTCTPQANGQVTKADKHTKSATKNSSGGTSSLNLTFARILTGTSKRSFPTMSYLLQGRAPPAQSGSWVQHNLCPQYLQRRLRIEVNYSTARIITGLTLARLMQGKFANVPEEGSP